MKERKLFASPTFHKTERNTTSDFPSPEVQRGVQIETPIPHPAELPVLVIRGGTARAKPTRKPTLRRGGVCFLS